MAHGAALLVFAKSPVPGQVKTRLTALLTPQEAAALYEAFLRDALDDLAGLGAPLRVLFPPGEDPPPGLLPSGATAHRQRGADLGERLLAAFVEAFRDGHSAAVALGTDHPTLPLDFVRLALAELDGPLRIALGPSADGGYYLLGMNHLYPALFEGMRYSHAAVFEETMDRAARTGAGLAVLPEWYDVDTPEDLARLARDLDAAPPDCARRTREAVAKLRALYPVLG
jgi:uncharacterized protein